MRVLVLGAGRIGAVHAANLDADPRVERVLVVDPIEERASAVVRAGRRVEALPSAGEALEGVDAVVVATPSERHFEDVSWLLDLGIPTFCEKPLALTSDDVREVEERAGRTILMVGFQRRFDDAYRRLQEACASARARGLAPTLYRLATADAAAPPAEFLAGAGSIFHDMLVHDFDVLDLVGAATPLRVSAQASPAGLDPDMTGWGTAAAVCTLSDGSLAVVSGSRRSGGGYETSCQVLSPAGTFGVGFAARGTPYDHLDSRGAARPPAWSGFLDRFRDAYRAEISHFLGVVEGAPLEGAGAAEMLRALELADAAERSARAGGSPYPVEAGQPARARAIVAPQALP